MYFVFKFLFVLCNNVVVVTWTFFGPFTRVLAFSDERLQKMGRQGSKTDWCRLCSLKCGNNDFDPLC